MQWNKPRRALMSYFSAKKSTSESKFYSRNVSLQMKTNTKHPDMKLQIFCIRTVNKILAIHFNTRNSNIVSFLLPSYLSHIFCSTGYSVTWLTFTCQVTLVNPIMFLSRLNHFSTSPAPTVSRS